MCKVGLDSLKSNLIPLTPVELLSVTCTILVSYNTESGSGFPFFFISFLFF